MSLDTNARSELKAFIINNGTVNCLNFLAEFIAEKIVSDSIANTLIDRNLFINNFKEELISQINERI